MLGGHTTDGLIPIAALCTGADLVTSTAKQDPGNSLLRRKVLQGSPLLRLLIWA